MVKNNEKELKRRISELEAENKRLRATINKLELGPQGFYTLNEQISSMIDLGKHTKKYSGKGTNCRGPARSDWK